MNFAHMVGAHDFENTSQQLLHSLLSWVGVILAVTAAIVVTLIIIKQRRLAHQKDHS